MEYWKESRRGERCFPFALFVGFFFFFFRSSEKYPFLKFFFCLFNLFIFLILFLLRGDSAFFLFLTESTDPQALSSSDLRCS